MDLQLYGIAGVPLIIALVQGAKASGMPVDFAFPLDLILGILAGLAVQYSSANPHWVQGVVIGIATGLSAAGIWSSISHYALSPSNTATGYTTTLLPTASISATTSPGVVPVPPPDPPST